MEKDTQRRSGIAYAEGTNSDEVPFFKYLYFEPEETVIKDGILLDEPIMPVAKEIGDETKFVNYFMDVLLDNEIDETIICSALADLKVKDIYVDTDQQCPDISTIYNPSLYDPTTEVCPVDVDTSSGNCDV